MREEARWRAIACITSATTYYIPVVKNCGPSADSVLSAAHRESALLAPGGVVPDRKGGE